MREKVTKLVESKEFINGILVLVVLNAFVIGIQTCVRDSSVYAMLEVVNNCILGIFVVELALELYAWRGDYFKSGWNVFDFIVVIASIVSVFAWFAPVQIFRTLRILRTFRALRLVSALKQMRVIIDAMLKALPGVAWTVVLLAIISYVFAVIGVFLYGEAYPEYFGNLGDAFFTLFTVATLEGWPDLARTIMATNPTAWLYFVPYVIIAAFIIMNVLVGVIVEAVQGSAVNEALSSPEKKDSLSDELLALQRQINVIQGLLEAESDNAEHQTADKG